jgi:hypothetical protein
LLVLLVLGIPRPPRQPETSHWDVLAVIVPRIEVKVPTVRGPRRLSVPATDDDRRRVRRELLAFTRRVERLTEGRLGIRLRIVTASRPLTTLSGPGPFFLSAADVEPLLDESASKFDSVLAFVKIGEDRGPAVPTRHFGGAFGGDRGIDGACFAAVTYRPRWLDGSGDVAVHEWLHHLDWALTEVGGFPDEAFPDPDEGRRGPRCCPDAPEGDGAFADHILARHLTPSMIRAADARRGPAVEDGWLRGWTLDGRPVAGAWRTVTLTETPAAAALPEGENRLLVIASSPVFVTPEGGPRFRVEESGTFVAESQRVTVIPARAGETSRVRIRALPAAHR